MKIDWYYYFNTVVFIVVISILFAIIIPLCFVNRLFGFLFIISLSAALIFAYDKKEMPDFLHMSSRHEYIVDGDFPHEYNRVYIKLFPGIWVKTERKAKDMQDFIEQKVEYQHKQKEAFKV